MDQKNESTVSSSRQSKISRLIDKYDLAELGLELEQLWTAEEDRKSLRKLASYFNRQLLEQALKEADVSHLDGDVENIYRLLTDDDVSSAELTRTQRRLERDGVDTDALEDDFATYQAIQSYLKDYRGAEYTPAETDPLKREATNVQKLRGRMVSVTEGNLEQLSNSDELTLGEFRTLADIRVVCEDCNTQFDVLELLDRGGCNCAD